MRDDDASGLEGSDLHDTADDQRRRGSEDLFGDFRVLSPGVHIVLDGRPVSHTGY